MKRIALTVRLECRDDIPLYCIDWMARNLAQYAGQEFHGDYDSDCCHPRYEGPPLSGDVSVTVTMIEDAGVVVLT